MYKNVLWSCLLSALLVACGDDDERGNGSSIDASTLLDSSVNPGDAGTLDGAAPVAEGPRAEDLYLVSTSITTNDDTTLLLMTGNALSNSAIDAKQGLQFAGGGSVGTLDGKFYVAESEKQTITRYTREGTALVKGPSLSYLGSGIEYFGGLIDIASADRAFIVSSDQLKIFEWNPTTMTTTTTHDISAFKREGWAQEFRGQFFRKSDGKLFILWAYTNNRVDFINDFVLGVFDTKTKAFKVLSDTSCPATAGFGGYFDENEDLYMLADSFGLFTKFGGFKDPKDACILRVKKGEDVLDPGFKTRPATALGGREPWGFYYAGKGIAYTTAVDPAQINKYASVFELIFAPIHSGFLIDVAKNTAVELTSIPLTGVGFESFNVEGRLLVPRTTGTAKIFDVEASESTIYDIKPDATATPLFALPGSVTEIVKVR